MGLLPAFVVNYSVRNPIAPMNIRIFFSRATLFGAIAGGLLLVPGLSAQAQMADSDRTLEDLKGTATTQPVNSLQELRDSAAELEAERSTRQPIYSGSSAEPSATGRSEDVMAKLSAETGQATVMLMNNTGAEVTYEVIGQTPPRMLAAGESAQLEALPMPVTITAERQDFGLVDMMVTVDEAGALNVALERSDFDEMQGALWIREDGFVFVN